MNNQPAEPINSNPATATEPSTGPRGSSRASSSSAFFRGVDWRAFLITFGCVWLGYYLTLAPEVTLEDSGELATGSFYAGIPHPPGYPVWTVYTWLWTVLVPIKNVAWRVALGEATSGALAAGLLGLMVSRVAGLLIQGVEDFNNLERRAEHSICLVCGFVAGMLLGFNGFMWSQSVIVEVYSFGVASLMVVLLCLLRWTYSPAKWRYLYLALFFHGISFTNHQTLIVAAMGIEVAIAAVSRRMGRYLCLGNSIIYIAGLILKQQHVLTALEQNPAIFVIFNVVGVSSIVGYCWFSIVSKETVMEYALDGALALFSTSLTLLPSLGWGAALVSLASLGALIWLAYRTRSLGLEWFVVIVCGFCWLGGAAFYFYMPLSGMTNPPMQWGYPRTVDGFIHAFTRGQYEKTHPTDLLHDPTRFITQLAMLGDGIIEEFNWVYAVLALVPFFFFTRIHKRERSWLIGITAIYLCLGVLLLILLNPPPDRAAQQLVRVFFTASHTLIALLVGAGLSLISAYVATHYRSARFWALGGGTLAAALAVLSFAELTARTFFGENASVSPGQLLSLTGQAFTDPAQFGLPVFAGLLLIGLSAAFVMVLWFQREKPPLIFILAIFSLMPLHSILTHWSDNEQRGHWFGYYFGHDMFTPPIRGANQQPLYPEMPRNAILFGGTDPGRFCPTYMIFCESFLPQSCQPDSDRTFDRRDVYIITQNALADGTYLEYIRAQYNRSTQIDPPFFQELLRSDKERLAGQQTNSVARLVQPLDELFETLGARIEKRRRTFTSWFEPGDFRDLRGLREKLQPSGNQDAVSGFVSEHLKQDTRELLANGPEAKLRTALARDLNHLLEADAHHKAGLDEVNQKETLFTTNRFREVRLSEYLQEFISQNPKGNSRIRLNRLLLEAAYPNQIAHSLGGVYPDREIYIPTPEDSMQCLSEYSLDAQRRMRLNQLKPGEELLRQGDRIQVSGPAAVMGINGLITKVIFDRNPRSEFFVEESFPLEWMYPHLSPYGIIMRINREPLGQLSEETLDRDHEFWSQYCGRLIGNWIRSDTSVRDITAWAERVYLHKNFRGFVGDRKFLRDDQAQKSFSKLRGAIAGLYYWRIATARPGSPERSRLIREADFAFKQAFALSPFNPEALFRYVNLLASPEVNRFDDALLLAETSQKLDPLNKSLTDLVSKLGEMKAQRANINPARLEQTLQQNPADFQAALNLAGEYFQLGQTGAALQALDRVLTASNAPTSLLRTLLPLYTSLTNQAKLMQTVDVLGQQLRSDPNNLEAALGIAEAARALHQPQAALQALDLVILSPKADPNIILQAAEQLVALSDYPRLELALDKLTNVAPNSPEAWYDLAALRSILGKTNESLQALRKALDLNRARLATDPKARNILQQLPSDPRFNAVRSLREFQQLAN
jgi:tetratricopeptide (TPR) repeat protein